MIRTIVRFPDPRLRIPALAVTSFDAALRALATDLLDTMRAAPGVGVTAPHIGVLQRVVVLELAAVRTYVNPVILWSSDEKARFTEGSISMPGAAEEVERPAAIRVSFQDCDGHLHEEEATGWTAACLQHEIDQLDGLFWLRRLSALKRDRLVKRFDKQQRTRDRTPG